MFTSHERAILLDFCHPTVVGGRRPIPPLMGDRTDPPPPLISACNVSTVRTSEKVQLECGPMPNVMVALPNIGGALCSTPQSLSDAHYLTAVQ